MVFQANIVIQLVIICRDHENCKQGYLPQTGRAQVRVTGSLSSARPACDFTLHKDEIVLLTRYYFSEKILLFNSLSFLRHKQFDFGRRIKLSKKELLRVAFIIGGTHRIKCVYVYKAIV